MGAYGNERRIVDPDTGGAKGQKLARFELIPQDALWKVAEHYGRGSRKYADRNWERGYAWSLSAGALLRHFSAFWRGENVDPDPSLYVEPNEQENNPSRHIDAVVWHALCLSAFDLRSIGTDDRPQS
jgi:hypothetical protein